mmetsp:Transcript_115460/g.361157  ORF Transcript_115460/g.361157 Transcript_115460/m.361157 type:complete len:90 (+) Transcript_115460:843-1112(+)
MVKDATLGNTAQPQNLFWTVCAPAGPGRAPGALQLGVGNGDWGDGYIWSYVPDFTWLVYGWGQSFSGRPGAKAQWLPEPALGLELPPCP